VQKTQRKPPHGAGAWELFLLVVVVLLLQTFLQLLNAADDDVVQITTVTGAAERPMISRRREPLFRTPR
jgi:hypothetical protein